MPTTTRRRLTVIAAAMALVAAACGGDDEPDVRVSDGPTDNRGIAAEVASYDLVAGRTGRFIVGLFAADKTNLVGFGTVTFRFAYLGTGRGDPPTAEQTEPITARFLPIPGQRIDPETPGPRFVSGSEATGVYGAYDVAFDKAGFWEVTIEADIDGDTHTTTSAFDVLDDSNLPAPGDPAPRTTQPLAGDPSVPAKAIDSRAGPDEPVPDPELHSVTIADAIAAGRPVMVVVSTPTYCQSRFCGPITDSVHALARQHGGAMDFVHLEVWEDFEANKLSPAAAEWIFPPGAEDAREPWVFVVGRDGTIVERFDNVATDAELEQAVERVLES